MTAQFDVMHRKTNWQKQQGEKKGREAKGTRKNAVGNKGETE